jgi:hypothetical protein
MRRLLALAIATVTAFSLGACTTFQDIENGLSGLVGKDISHAINKLGYPAGERSVAGKKIYVWSTQNSGSYVMPQTNYNTGYVGGMPVSYTTTGYTTHSYNYACTIEIIVNKADTIETWQYSGNVGGCSHYASRLAMSGPQSEAERAAPSQQTSATEDGPKPISSKEMCKHLGCDWASQFIKDTTP